MNQGNASLLARAIEIAAAAHATQVDNWRSVALVPLVPPGDLAQIPESPMPADPRIRTYGGPPVFFGH